MLVQYSRAIHQTPAQTGNSTTLCAPAYIGFKCAQCSGGFFRSGGEIFEVFTKSVAFLDFDHLHHCFGLPSWKVFQQAGQFPNFCSYLTVLVSVSQLVSFTIKLLASSVTRGA
eukprot:TRINITY_DN10392_c0_g1_i5.p2 TRINITY_DN10392_c0_g1~~TRINITY_DN10392_c0_g1_i5.p2  ORF type:complete len:113 (+),score=24.41 TRINITY_DN10392_c0_g1_i5:1008-1346(+)